MPPIESPPGKLVLFGSGETSPSGQPIHERLLRELKAPVRVAVLETPAGFQPNSEVVARKVGEFMEQRLQNFSPQVRIIPARKKGTAFSPDDPAIIAPILESDYIFMGPGSPTFLVRQLAGTLAWRHLIQQHRQGAFLCMASAAALAISAKVIPVYEVFKAGDDPHWVDGLDLLGPYGMELAIVPHWNNTEGGDELDTSRCFMGRVRMEKLRQQLPSSTRILGIDEHTAVIFDFEQACCLVQGKGTVRTWSRDEECVYAAGESFPFSELGSEWHATSTARREQTTPSSSVPVELPPHVAELIEQRERARKARDWSSADALRRQIADLGYEIQDTPQGPSSHPRRNTRSSL
jgi:cyanophycinase-like exopeptidase